MAPFKCWGCDEYNEGEGTKRCIGCVDIQYVTERRRTIQPDYYDPHIMNQISESVTTSVWARLKRLNEREATMIIQYTLLEMTQDDIASYHGIDQAIVSKTIALAQVKARST